MDEAINEWEGIGIVNLLWTERNTEAEVYVLRGKTKLVWRTCVNWIDFSQVHLTMLLPGNSLYVFHIYTLVLGLKSVIPYCLCS